MLNTTATKGYNIIELEKEKSRLIIEQERLNKKIGALESLDALGNQKANGLMEDVEQPDYLVIKENVQYVYNN